MKKIRLGTAAFVKHPAATVTFQKWLSALDGNQGDKEQAKIMIQPFPSGRRQAAARTGPGLIIDLHFLRLHSTNEDEDTPPKESAGF
jgi:hypothetical protein